MSTDALGLLRAALEHHVETYGRWELLPPSRAAVGAPGAVDAAGAADAPETPDVDGPVHAAGAADAPGPLDADGPVHAAGAVDAPGPATDPSPSPPGSPYDRIEALIPTDSPIRSMETLDDLARFVADAVLIPLDAARLNPVFGVGRPDADLMVVGEAPGADEDRQGEPFVGRAGQLLTQILKSVGFERDDVYIANILKSRPPNNRDPLPEEVAAHLPILYRQIALIRPRLLLCVGKTAGNSLLGQATTLSGLRGRFHDFHGLPVLVTFHPAALLRNSRWKRPTWEDVQLLRRRFDQLVGGA